MRRSLIVLLIGSLAGVACLNMVKNVPPKNVAAASLHWSDSHVSYAIAGTDDAERTADTKRQFPRVYHTAFKDGKYGNDWHEAHREVKKYLAGIQHESYFFISAQKLSCIMLDKYLLKGSVVSDEEKEAISYYADLLQQHNTPEYEIIARTMLRLKEFRSPEELSAMAKKYMPLVEKSITEQVHHVKQCDSISGSRQLSCTEGRQRRKAMRSIEANMRALAVMKQFVIRITDL